MAKFLSVRNSFVFFKRSLLPNQRITLNNSRNSVIPNTVPIPDKTAEDELRNLRIAVSPSYGYGSNSYKNKENTSSCKSSGLAGDPRRLGSCQDIRAEILERWNKRPQPDIHKEWLKNIMFN